MPNSQEDQGTKQLSVEDQAISALSSLDEDDQIKVIDYIKTLVHLTEGSNESR